MSDYPDLQPLLDDFWTPEGDCLAIRKEFKFASFRDAISFMVRISFEAEEMDHHPEWENIYDRVRIRLTTHDAGRVTDKDVYLAQKIEIIFAQFTPNASQS